jgi:hypothetical protein
MAVRVKFNDLLTQAQYDALGSVEVGTLYFTTDTHRQYLNGNIVVGVIGADTSLSNLTSAGEAHFQKPLAAGSNKILTAPAAAGGAPGQIPVYTGGNGVKVDAATGVISSLASSYGQGNNNNNTGVRLFKQLIVPANATAFDTKALSFSAIASGGGKYINNSPPITQLMGAVCAFSYTAGGNTTGAGGSDTIPASTAIQPLEIVRNFNACINRIYDEAYKYTPNYTPYIDWRFCFSDGTDTDAGYFAAASASMQTDASGHFVNSGGTAIPVYFELWAVSRGSGNPSRPRGIFTNLLSAIYGDGTFSYDGLKRLPPSAALTASFLDPAAFVGYQGDQWKQAADKSTIGANHAAITAGNPHNTTAAMVPIEVTTQNLDADATQNTYYSVNDTAYQMAVDPKPFPKSCSITDVQVHGGAGNGTPNWNTFDLVIATVSIPNFMGSIVGDAVTVTDSITFPAGTWSFNNGANALNTFHFDTPLHANAGDYISFGLGTKNTTAAPYFGLALANTNLLPSHNKVSYNFSTSQVSYVSTNQATRFWVNAIYANGAATVQEEIDDLDTVINGTYTLGPSASIASGGYVHVRQNHKTVVVDYYNINMDGSDKTLFTIAGVELNEGEVACSAYTRTGCDNLRMIDGALSQRNANVVEYYSGQVVYIV